MVPWVCGDDDRPNRDGDEVEDGDMAMAMAE